MAVLTDSFKLSSDTYRNTAANRTLASRCFGEAFGLLLTPPHPQPVFDAITHPAAPASAFIHSGIPRRELMPVRTMGRNRFGLAPLVETVEKVVLMRSELEVLWIAAAPDIAFVHDLFIWRYLALPKSVCQSMNSPSDAAVAHVAVA
jgi:hypothetical protein